MAKIIAFKTNENTPIYGDCSGCGCDLWLAQMDDDGKMVVALECSGCRGVVELEDTMVIECVFE